MFLLLMLSDVEGRKVYYWIWRVVKKCWHKHRHRRGKKQTKGRFGGAIHTVDRSEILDQLAGSLFHYTVVKVDGATPKRWRFVRGHDKPIHGSG